MHLKSNLLIALMLVACMSCKKSGTEQEQPKNETKKVLSKITEVRADQPANTAIFTNFTYDDQGRLILEKGADSETRLFYKQNQLYQIIRTRGTTKVTTDVVYENNRILRVSNTLTIPNQADKIVHTSCFYDGEKVIRLDRNENGLLVAQFQYEYASEKLSKVTIKDARYVSVFEYTSDDKKNIRYGIDFTVRQAIDLMDSQPTTANNFNTVKYAIYELDKIVNSDETSFVYTYDADGYPLTLVRSYKHPSMTAAVVTKYSYEYKTLEL